MIPDLSVSALLGATTAAVIAPIVVGVGLLRATGAVRPGAAGAAAGFLLGYGWIGATISALLVAGVPLRGAWCWVVVALPLAAYFRRPRAAATGRGAADHPSTVHHGSSTRIVLAVLIVVLGVQFARLWCEALLTPVGSHDAVAIWALKSISFFHANGIDPTLFTLDRDASLHADYPIGVPAFGAWILANAGVADERLLKLPFALVWLAVVVLLAEHGGRRIGRVPALAFAIGFGLIDAIYYQGLLVMADLPLAAFALVAWTARDRGDPAGGTGTRWVAALALAFAVNTKNEGATLVVAAAALTFIIGPGRVGARLRRTAPLVVVPALMLLPWLLFRLHHGLYSDLAHGVFLFGQSPDTGPPAGLGRIPFLVAETLSVARMTSPVPVGMWDLFWFLATLAAIALGVSFARNRRPSPEAARFAAGALAILTGFFAALCISPHDVEWHAQTSLPRMLVQAAPLVAAGIISTISAFPARDRSGTLVPGAQARNDSP